jgi:hypothetical protein
MQNRFGAGRLVVSGDLTGEVVQPVAADCYKREVRAAEIEGVAVVLLKRKGSG